MHKFVRSPINGAIGGLIVSFHAGGLQFVVLGAIACERMLTELFFKVLRPGYVGGHFKSHRTGLSGVGRAAPGICPPVRPDLGAFRGPLGRRTDGGDMTRKTALATAVRIVPLGFGLALLAWVATRLGVHGILRDAGDMRWSLVPVLLLYTGHEMSRATALMWCVRGQNALSFVEAFLIRLSGEAVECLTFTGPMLSEPTKAWLLQRTGLELSEGLSATLTEYLASMVAGAVTAVIGVSYVLLVLRPVGPVRAAAIVILSSMSVFLVFMTIAVATRIRMASMLVNVIIRRTIPGLVAIEDALIRTTHETPRRFLAIMSAEFAAQGFLGLELWALLASLHLPCPLARAALMEGVMKFLNAGAFFVPGQAGVAEGSSR